MKAAAVVAHSGGPTAVINASLAGLIEEWRASKGVGQLFGALSGLQGLLKDQFLDLLEQDVETVQQVSETPGSAIGSSRRKLEQADYELLLDVFRRRNVRWFFYTGGNGSMETALQIEHYAKEAEYELRVIGIPKTIDNDLQVTDHTPGYASTARFFACAARDVGEDNRSLPSPICVLEVLGRNAGWIVAATSLARHNEDDAPHLIYLPERPISLDQMASDVERVYRKIGRVLIAVCEGQRDEKGETYGASVDRPGSKRRELASNLGHTVAHLLATKLSVRARAEKPGLLGRCCGPYATRLDREEAWECGRAAAKAGIEGQAGVMVAIRRDSNDPYESSTFLTPLESVAGSERLIPLDWIHRDGNDVMPEFVAYARPLIGAIEPWQRFQNRSGPSDSRGDRHGPEE